MEDQAETLLSVKTEKTLTFSRRGFYFLFFTLIVAPSIFALFFHADKRFFLIGTICCLGAYFLLRGWERKMQRSVGALVKKKMESLFPDPSREQGSVEEHRQQILSLQRELEEARRGYEHQIDLLLSSANKSKQVATELTEEVEGKKEEVHHLTLTLEEMQREFTRQQEEFGLFQEEAKKEIHQKETLLAEYQRTVSDQRVVIEKKQRYIAKLEGKVRDLMYEIRSLLQLEEPAPPSSPLPLVETESQIELEPEELLYKKREATTYDFALQLQKYLQIAQNFTGAEHLGYMNGKSPRFSDLSLDSYAIDLRRLFDQFRDETEGIVFIYSRREERFLFMSSQIKVLLGFSAEKMMKDFDQLIESGYPEWTYALAKLPSLKETNLKMALRAKTGEILPFQCFMGLILQGPFANHVIGIFAKEV